jgi:peptidoglycan/LPS O-acetylase OafA/YrhL
MTTLTLEKSLIRENNNLDLYRLFLACLVIVGHAHALVAVDKSNQDLVQSMLHFDYSGSLAVKAFFFLSGLVVTNSIIQSPRILEFTLSRFFRVFPALIICVLLSALVLGPLYTQLTIDQYFSNPNFKTYVLNNLTLKLHWELPGVFLTNPLRAVNGSLWTLPLEVACYVVLVALALIGLFRSRISSSIVIILIICVTAFYPGIAGFLGFSAEAELLPACFALGSLFAINKQYIQVRWSVLCGLILISFLLKNTLAFKYLFYISFFYGSILIACTNLVLKLRTPGDFSYGVYLYGFPVQQMFVASNPTWGVLTNQIATLTCALLLAVASWYAIERQGISLGRRLAKKVRSRAISDTFSV